MSIRTEVECIERYNHLTHGGLDEVLEFLLTEKAATPDEIKGVRSSSDMPKSLQSLIMRLKSEDRVQLVEYNWEILPIERIKIYFVTRMNSRTFTYNY
jgi:hypothetical protein